MPDEYIAEVSRPEDGLCAWPTMIQCSNQELLIVCSGKRSKHVCPYGRVLLFRSRDRGRTWGQAQSLTVGPIDDRDAGILELADGTLIVTWFTSMTWAKALSQTSSAPSKQPITSTKRAQWAKLRQSLSDAECEAALGCWAIRSTDGGQTWSKPVSTLVSCPHGPIQLSNGRLLMVGSVRAENALRDGRKGSPFADEIGVSESTDGGQSWHLIALIQPRKGYQLAHYHEPHVVETHSGRLVVLLRNHHPQTFGILLQSFSDDGGRSWSLPAETNHWGYPAHLLRLNDGRLLASYSHRRAPHSIRAIMSANEGADWSEPRDIHLANGQDFGYPSTVHNTANSFLSTWYESSLDADAATLKVKRWTWR